MAVRMDLIDALLVLAKGGVLVEYEPSAYGKHTYRIYRPSLRNSPARCAGHITEKQYEKLQRRGLLRQFRQKTDSGGVWTYHELDAARVEVEYGKN